MDRILRFMQQLLGGSNCCGMGEGLGPLPLDPKEQRGRRLEKRAAALARATAPRLLT